MGFDPGLSLRRTGHGPGRALICAVALGAAILPTWAGSAADAARVLDRLHQAAAVADEAAYFELFADDAVFLGTDASERWTVLEFRAYAHPHFARGKGWTYTVREGGRHVYLSADGNLAWFDEVLDNAKYGECRGTGVLRRVDGRFRIVQYNLTIPIPNEIAPDVVAMIAGSKTGD